MDGAIEKLGIYEFFCVFLSGLLFSSICLCSGIPTYFVMWTNSDAAITLLTFLSFSFFWGLIFQGIGSFLDHHCECVKLLHHARKNYLEAGKHRVFKEESERIEFYQMVDKTITEKYNGPKQDLTENEKCIWAYQYYATVLEYNKKDAKIERIGSLYGLLRSLMVMGIVLIILHFTLHFSQSNRTICIGCIATQYLFTIKNLIFLGIAFFFRFRASEFAKYKVRVVLREYRQFASENDRTNGSQNQMDTSTETGN